MANDKKFIVKNGLLTQETVVIGSTTDNGVNKLQVTGSSLFTQGTGSTPTISITNSGGVSNSVIAEFVGDSDSLQILNIGTGDYALLNSQQNNGIRFYDDTSGIEILYNGSVDIDFNSSGIDFKREPSYNGNVFWNAGNDGAGSGLDADLIDGLDSTQFLRSDESDTMTGDLTIIGNLTVSGTTTTVNTETILLADNIITLNSNHTGAPSQDAGWEVNRGSSSNSSVLWDETNDWFKLISAGTDLGRIITTADEGSGNGFDADTVDGLDSTQFLRSDVDDTAAGNITIQGNLTVGNNTAAGATIVMDGQAGNRYIFSNNGEIGFLNSAFAYAAYSDGSNNWRVLNDTYAKRFIDSDNNSYLLDPAGTSVLNTVDLEGSIRHNGDTDTYINFNAANSFEVRTGGSQRLVVNDTAVTAVNQMRSPIYYDSDDITYYGNFAGSSRLNDISLVGQIIHDGDTDTYLDFNAADSFQVVTGGTARLTVANTAVTASVDVVGPRFVDSNNNAYYADPASTSVFNTLGLDSDLFHNGDTDNKISFTTDTQTFTTGNVARLTINNTSVTGSVDFIAPRFVDSGNGSYYADFANAGVSIAAAGTINAANANFYNGGTSNDLNIGRNVNERFNFNVTDGLGYIRYYQDETDTTDHSVNFEIVSASAGNNRFNFNADINAGSNNIVGGLGVFTTGVYAPVYYDLDNEIYYADFASTSVSINAAGRIQAGNGALATPAYTFGSDTNTGMYRFAADTIGFSTGGNDEFRIYTTYALAVGQMRAPIFYDSNNTAYYGNFASTSVFNTLGIDSDLFHNGDTDTKLSFGTDTITLTTANAARLTINTTAITAALNTYAPRFYTDDYLVHTGDENTYIGFNAADTFGVWTGGANRLSVDNDSADFSVNVYAPRYYDSNNNAYYVDPASDSVMNTINLDDYIIHNGDTDTYFGFDAADNYGVWVANSQKFDISSTVAWINNVNVGIGTTTPSRLQYGTLDPRLHVVQTGTNGSYNLVARFEAGSDADNTGAAILINHSNDRGLLIEAGRESSDRAIAHLGLVVSSGTNTRVLSLKQDSTAYRVGINSENPAAVLDINNRVTMGANPFAIGNRYIRLGDAGTADFTLAGDSSRNVWAILEGSSQFVFSDSGATILLAADAASLSVVVGDQTPVYTVTDNTSVIDGPTPGTPRTITDNKLHVNGSIQLNGNQDAIVFGRGTSTFLMDEELGFGWGGGFYMTEGTTVKIRNDKALSTGGNITAGNMYASRFYDSDNNAYYVDPNGDSQMNTIDIDDYIRHRGDTNTYIGFNAADTFRVVTGGTERLQVNNTYVQANNQMRAPIYYDSADTSYYWNPNTSSAHRFQTPSGYVDMGPMNTSYSHFQTDRPKFYFNKTAAFDGGGIEAYDGSATASFPIYYDWNDTFYYGDFGGFSRMNGITFGNPGNGTNTKGRWLSIEGNTDAGGEGSARIFFSEHNSTTASMDAYGMSLVYIGGSATITSASGQPVTVSGISNGEWGLLGHNNNVNGAWAMRGPRDASYVQASGSFRAPIFYDSNNTSFYVDPASTSITNVMRANQFQVDGSTYIIDSPSGNYGSIRVDGAAGGWAGYAIRDDWVFMADGATNAGIYNDTDNEWAIRIVRNAGTDLYYNGVKQAETENGYFLATNQMRAPIYYAPSSTSYWLDLDVGNTSDALRIPGRINRQGFATGNGASNLFLTAQDRNHFIWNTATNWGIFWATDTSASYRYTPFGDNMITFVGAGNVRSAIDLDNGNAYFQGEVFASNFNINGGNENLGLLKTYGSGLGDTMLFDGTEYWEKRVIQSMQGSENPATTVTGEFVKNNNAPVASSYVLRTSTYRTFDSDYIPVEPGEEIYGEIAVNYVSGSGGLVYMGVRRYDKDKNPIAGNDGIEYFVVSAANHTGGWTTFRGHTTIPTSHTPYNGSDGGGCKYVRVIVLMNYPNGTGPATREYGPPILKRANHLSNIVTQNITAEGNVYANRYYDRNDVSYYVDPASTSIMNDVRANIFYDRGNTTYYLDPASTATSLNVRGEIRNPSIWINDGDNNNNYNENIRLFNAPNGVSVIAFSASGTSGTPTTSILGYSDRLETRYQANWQMRLYNNRADFVDDVRATVFYDRNDTTFYTDPASGSRFRAVEIRDQGLRLARQYNQNGIWFNAGTDANHVLWNHYYGGPNARGAAGSGGFDGMLWNTYQGLRIRGGSSGAYNIARFSTDGAGNGNGHYVQLYAQNVEQLGTRAGYGFAPNQMRSPIYYDSNNTAFYVDPASTSITNTMRANRFEVDSATYYIDTASGDYGSIRVVGNRNGWAGYAINDDWVFMSSGPASSGIYNDTNNEWAILFAQNSDVQIFFNGTWEERSRSGYMEARGSYRAPIFYDSNDTNFYVNPNGSSRIVNLDATGYITAEGHEVLTRNLQTTSGSQGWDLHGNFAMQAIYGSHDVLNQGNVYNAALFKGAGWTLYGFNGSAWVNLGTCANLTNGKGKANWGGVNLPRGYTQFIIDCGNSFGYQFMSAFTLTHSTSGNTMDIYFEKSTSATYNSGTWTTMGSATGVSSWPGGTSVKFSDVVGASYPPYVRLRIIPNFSHPSNSISLGQFFVSGAYGGANSLLDWDNNRNVSFNGDITASRFIDRDNTGRYLDPNGTSSIDGLLINGGNFIQLNTSSGNARGYIQATETNDAHLIIATSGGEDISFRDGGLGGQWNMIIRGNGDVLTLAGHYAQIFYDRNNTTYRGDFASTSVMNILDIRGEIYNDGWFRNDVNGRGLYNTATTQHFYSDSDDGWNVAGGSNVNWIRFRDEYGGTIRGYVYAENNNNIGFLNNSGGWALRTNNSTIEAYGSFYADIMYDRNNTGRYVDPSATSQLNQVVINGQSTMATQRAWVASNYGHGVYGLYSPTRYQHVWSMGTSYNLAADGTSTGNGGNLYGLAWAYNPNYSFAGSNAQAKSGLNHQLLLMMNGVTYFAAGNGMWTSGVVTTTNSIYAPIFYDTNNTAFRVDPTGTSRMNTIEVDRINMADRGDYITFYGDNSTQHSITSRSQTGGISDDLRFNSYHNFYFNADSNNNNSDGGIYLGEHGGAEGNIVTQWAFQARTDGVTQASGSVRGPIFYDSNDTAYYLDPNSTSDLNQVYINNLRIDGTTAGIYTNNTYLDIRYGSTGAGGIRLYDAGNVLQGYWYANGSGEHGFLDNDGAWAHRIRTGANSQLFYTDGNLEMQITTSFVQAYGSFRAPIFYDSNNTGYYIHGDGTSRLNVLRTNRLYPCYDNNTGIYFDYPTGNYGSIQINGGGAGGYEGYSIRGEYVFMSADASNVGIYNDVDNEWMIFGARNAGVDLYYNGAVQLETENGYGFARNQMRSPIFYDSNDTGFYADPNSTSSFNALRATEFYARNWFRNDNAGEGLYNQATATHFYSSTSQEWRITGNQNGAAMNLRGLATYNGNSRFWIHGDTSGWQGFLNSAGSWKFRFIHSDGYSPGLRFEETSDETWTGNPGADVGKIEYHANRFYIAAGSNSDRIVQFRRDGTDRSYIANDGVFVGTATSARWADLAERYEADAIYEPGTVLGIGGDKEVTLYQPGMPLAGAISTKPAYRMNDDNYGNDDSIESKMNPFVALKGRIPVKINGSAKKGQWIIADKDGKGRAVDFRTPGINSYDIIGIALEDGENEVEVKI